MEHTRRNFLKAVGMLSGVAAASGVIPESIRKAMAIEPAQGSTYLDAEHIVILMQENRSFDHALGTLQGVRGFNDPRALRLPNGNSVFTQTDHAGNTYAPWRLDIKDTRITWMGSVPHSRHSQVDAWNDGRHDNWLDAKRVHEYADLPLTMGHYTREDLPFYYALADAFTVCDQNYCSVMTSTTPNRSVFWTGTVRDEQHTSSRVFMRNDEILVGGMTWKTFPERLHEAGISWKFYQNELTNAGGMSNEEQAWLSNFGCNLLEFFAAYNVEAYAGSVSAMQERITSLERQIQKLEAGLQGQGDREQVARMQARIDGDRKRIKQLKASLANSGETRYQQLDSRQKALHEAAFVTNSADAHYHALETLPFDDAGKAQQMNVPKGDILYQFRKDVAENKLPTVSWLSAPEKFSDHPTSPWYGAWYVSEVMDILTANPEVWKKTIFILTYDENDGYFDHAPSYVAADPKRPMTGGASAGIDTGLEYTYAEDEVRQGVSPDQARSGPIGLGYRVPMIVASPWTRGGWVNSQIFDHASTLMFLEHFIEKKSGKTVQEENISAWRRAICGDLTSCFRPHNAGNSRIDYLNRDKFVVGIEKARHKELPSNFKRLNADEIRKIGDDLLHAPSIAHQEPGVRPACAIPYELSADGTLNAEQKSFTVRLGTGSQVHGAKTVGSPFNIYLHNLNAELKQAHRGMIAATYVVKAGDALEQTFPLSMFEDSSYLLEIHGPNGFYRSFSGNERRPKVDIQPSVERNGTGTTGNLQIQISNPSSDPLTVIVADKSYKAGRQTHRIAAKRSRRLVLNLGRSHGWYDFTVEVEGFTSQDRFAGHVDTGSPSFTDPLMGGVV